MKCEFCNKEHDGTYASGRFCSKECARKFSSYKNIKGLKKEVTCIECGKKYKIGKNASNDSKYHICPDCRTEYYLKNKEKVIKEKIIPKSHLPKKCPICGQENCKNDFCKNHNYQQFRTLINFFGFDRKKYKTLLVEEEFNRVRNMIYDLYWNQHLSTTEIGKMFNFKSCNSGTHLFKYLDIPLKTPSEAIKENVLLCRVKLPSNKIYHDGWHTTWNGKEVYLRSSFESDFAKELDEQKIDYEVEFKHIKYFDTQLNEYRCAIPDFYIPSTNTIIEIKSKWTLDKQNMKDKFKAYKEFGYNCKLICDHEEMLL